jgi:hypothetical protein
MAVSPKTRNWKLIGVTLIDSEAAKKAVRPGRDTAWLSVANGAPGPKPTASLCPFAKTPSTSMAL